jgi:hypothetical protein
MNYLKKLIEVDRLEKQKFEIENIAVARLNELKRNSS